MPQNKTTYRLYAPYIEAIHDYGISFNWPDTEPVRKLSCKDVNLLYSAAEAPYAGGFGIEYYPTLNAKAAYLFFHIASSQIFENGNKRTAIMCLDQILLANSMYLILDNNELQKLAEETAEWHMRGRDQKEVLREISQKIAENSLPIRSYRKKYPRIYKSLLEVRKSIRKYPANRPSARLLQEERFDHRG